MDTLSLQIPMSSISLYTLMHITPQTENKVVVCLYEDKSGTIIAETKSDRDLTI